MCEFCRPVTARLEEHEGQSVIVTVYQPSVPQFDDEDAVSRNQIMGSSRLPDLEVYDDQITGFVGQHLDRFESVYLARAASYKYLGGKK